jgi:hypothetical protein
MRSRNGRPPHHISTLAANFVFGVAAGLAGRAAGSWRGAGKALAAAAAGTAASSERVASW